MTETEQLPNQITKQDQNLKRNQDETISMIGQHQFIETQQKVAETSQEKLKVDILPQVNQYNPELTQQATINEFENDSDPYGPFSQVRKEPLHQLKSVNESINYDIDISPILTKIQTQGNKALQKIKNKTRFKNNASILTEQSNIELSSRVDKQQLQKEILALAKNIRQKVKRKQLAKQIPLEVNSPSGLSKKMQNNQTDLKMKKLYEKRQSLFEKYSYPRSVGIDLSQLQRQQERLKAKKYATSRVYNQQSQQSQNMKTKPLQQKSPTLKSNRSQLPTQDSRDKPQMQLPKLKLNFDKTHHKYQMTQFRKSILSEKKDREIAKSLVVKEKEDALKKRRQIYNTSRYHPVGIRLSALKNSIMPSQLPQNSVINIVAEKTNGSEVLNTKQPQILSKQWQQTIPEDQTKYVSIQGHFAEKLQEKVINSSEIKSSMTFNFSFSDPLIPQTYLKSQSQILNQISNITKQLQNDSTKQEKTNYIVKQQQQGHTNGEIEAKKWMPLPKEMTQSKHLDEVQRLRNSSASQDYEYNYTEIQLQYSHV